MSVSIKELKVQLRELFVFKPTLIYIMWGLWLGGVLTLVPALGVWATIYWAGCGIFLTIATIRSLKSE